MDARVMVEPSAVSRRDVVFVRSRITGRTALVAQLYIYRKPDSDTPEVRGLAVTPKEFRFSGSDVVINGVQRRFWTIVIPRDSFRELLKLNKAALVEGSDSAFVRTHASKDAIALMKQAVIELPGLRRILRIR